MERGKGLNKKKQSSAQLYLNLWPLDYDSYSQLLRYNGCHIWKIWEAKIIIHFYWQKLIKVSIRKICTVASFFKCNSFLCVWNNEILKECNVRWPARTFQFWKYIHCWQRAVSIVYLKMASVFDQKKLFNGVSYSYLKLFET